MPVIEFHFRSLLRVIPYFVLAAGLTGQDLNLNRDLTERDRFTPDTSRTLGQRLTRRVSGPIMGLVFSKEAGLRPILGVPGAAMLGLPIAGIPEISAAVVPGGGDYALATAAGNRQPFLLGELGDPLSVTPLPDVPPGVDEIVMSPGGSAVALRYKETARVVILTGIPNAPAPSWEIDADMLPGPLASLAVSDDGGTVLAATGDESQQSVLLLSADQDWRYLATVDGRASFAFLNGSSDVLLAGGGANQVFLIQDLKGAARMLPLAGQSEGVSRPVAVAASADNQRAIIANSDPGGIISVALEGGDVQAVACGCNPTGLNRLRGNAVFRLNEPSAAPLYVYDGDARNPRIVFVPPAAGVPSSQGGSR